MGFFRKVMSTLTLGIVPDDEYIEEKKRQQCPFDFNRQIISESEFRNIVETESKKIKRITAIEFDNCKAKFTVKSTSGISEWTFILDFNDFGKFTGESWITNRDNYDSSIPKVLQNNLLESFNQYLCTKDIFVCPNCDASLSFQMNFDADRRVNVCDKCKCELLNPKCNDEYIWHCIKCGTILNNQPNWIGENRDFHVCSNCDTINTLDKHD